MRYTFGVRPLQQYLVAFPGGRLQALPVAWDTVRRRWFDLHPEERIAPGDPLHWTGRYQNWNAQCAACHSTNLVKGYDAATDRYATTWSDLDVGCEACHGPGSSHVAWAKRAASRGDTGAGDRGDRGLTVDFAAAAGNRLEVETCAPCHSRRAPLTDGAAPGAPLLDHYVPVRLEQGLYFPDGQIEDEVYVYGSFVQSRMFTAGVRCSDCHDPHTLEPLARGNALCTRCHGEHPDPRFPMLKAGRYDTPAHHLHTPGEPGASCVDCHMPARTYMVVDPRRDHGFRVPDPAGSARLGAPDVCAACHRRSAAWATANLRRVFGAGAGRASFGPALAAGRAHAAGAGDSLAALAADARRPAIVRATALELMPANGAAGDPQVVAALSDPEPLVRLAAVRAMEFRAPAAKLDALAPLLDDPLRAIRAEAARVLAAVPRARFTDATARAWDAACREYRQAQQVVADRPAGPMNLALLAEAEGDDARAEQLYRTALARDSTFLPARFNLVQLYDRTGRADAAERALRAGLAIAPGNGELHYALGLLLAEVPRDAASADELAKAEALLPGRARVAFNHGLVLERLGRPDEARRALERALALAPDDLDILAASAALHLRRGRTALARSEAAHMAELDPSDPRGPSLLREISRTERRPAGR